jgi:hypothetical protein
MSSSIEAAMKQDYIFFCMKSIDKHSLKGISIIQFILILLLVSPINNYVVHI